MIKLGDKVRDTVTGFSGIVIATTDWLHGCRRCLVQPDKLKDGKIIDSVYFDEPQLDIVASAKAKRGSTDTGGPMPAPQQKASPTRR